MDREAREIIYLVGSVRLSVSIIMAITNSVLNSSCFAWHPYGKLELFKTELVIDRLSVC